MGSFIVYPNTSTFGQNTFAATIGVNGPPTTNTFVAKASVIIIDTGIVDGNNFTVPVVGNFALNLTAGDLIGIYNVSGASMTFNVLLPGGLFQAITASLTLTKIRDS